MRIALVTTEFVTEPYFSGGLANYINRVALALRDFGHDVHIFTLSSLSEAYDYHGVSLHRVTSRRYLKPRDYLRRMTRNRLRYSVNATFESYALCAAVVAENRVHRFDVVQVPNYNHAGLFITLFMRIPVVTRASSLAYLWYANNRQPITLDRNLMIWLEKLQFRLSKNIYAPSFYIGKSLAGSFPRKTVRVIRSPFFVESVEGEGGIMAKDLEEGKYLLFFGRLEWIKGVHVLAQALPAAMGACADMHVAFVGHDSRISRNETMSMFIRKECADHLPRLHFINALEHHELYPVVSGARLVVLPSLADNLPNVLLEAMGLGKPVIGTINASFDELLEDGVNGFLVPSDDVQALSEKIIEAWRHPDLERIGASAKEVIGELAPGKTVREMESYFHDLIFKHKQRRWWRHRRIKSTHN